MTNTYTWAFERFETIPSKDGLSDIVTTIQWRLNATDGTHNATVYGTVGVGAPDSADFTPYADLTEEWAIAQVTAQHKLLDLQLTLDTQIAHLISPPLVNKAPPFAVVAPIVTSAPAT